MSMHACMVSHTGPDPCTTRPDTMHNQSCPPSTISPIPSERILGPCTTMQPCKYDPTTSPAWLHNHASQLALVPHQPWAHAQLCYPGLMNAQPHTCKTSSIDLAPQPALAPQLALAPQPTLWLHNQLWPNN